MQIVVGLGNPGSDYARQRHNIGFMAVEAIAGAHGFGPWRSKFQAEISEGRLGGAKILLMKPQTYMNRSGDSVGEAVRFFKLAPEDVTVFHDELDLPPGRMRVKRGGGHAGHNGLRSIHAQIGEGYRRVRLGIGHPGDKSRVSGYVLHDFGRAELDWVEPLLAGIAAEAGLLAAGEDNRFQTAVAARVAPPKAPAPPKPPKSAPEAASEPSPGEGEAPASPFGKLTGLFGRK